MIAFLSLFPSLYIGMISWPEGLYGLPMAINGCPVDSSINWKTGTLYQDCEDTDPRTQHSPDLHLNAFVKYGDVQRSFCMKTSSVNDSNRDQWPSGKYCIYLWGKTCPSGMLEGWVQWDDENTIIIYNKNTRRGTLPTGVYDQDTWVLTEWLSHHIVHNYVQVHLYFKSFKFTNDLLSAKSAINQKLFKVISREP